MNRLPLFSVLLILTVFWAGCDGASSTESPPPASELPPAFEEIFKVDVHSHIFEDIPALNAMMRRNNVQILNICNVAVDLDYVLLQHEIAREINRKHPDLFPWASTFDLSRIHEADYAEQAISQLDETYDQGALMTKIWKEVGLEIKHEDGSFILPDDPIFDPIYAHMARRGKPLLAHLAEPIDAWLPLDPESAHYHYYSRTPEWHLYGKPEYPHHSEIIAARDRILEKHPDLIVIGAHLGSLEHDVDEIAERLDRYPNFYVEVSARTRNLTRQPTDKVRDFFITYQDRILYGVDILWRPERLDTPPTDDQRTAFIQRLENRYRDDYRYYAGTGMMEYSDRPVESLALPRSVLEKFYHGNAHRIIPGLSETPPIASQ